jgi:hypothetical protein
VLAILLWDNVGSAGLLAIRGGFLAGVEQLGLCRGVGGPVGYVNRYRGEECTEDRMQVRVVTDASP